VTVYLIHFAQPFHHAQHYLGTARHLPTGLDEHARGEGAKLMAAVCKAGIGWWVIRTWPGDFSDERRLKRRHNGRKLCPICTPSARGPRGWRTGILLPIHGRV